MASTRGRSGLYEGRLRAFFSEAQVLSEGFDEGSLRVLHGPAKAPKGFHK